MGLSSGDLYVHLPIIWGGDLCQFMLMADLLGACLRLKIDDWNS